MENSPIPVLSKGEGSRAAGKLLSAANAVTSRVHEFSRQRQKSRKLDSLHCRERSPASRVSIRPRPRQASAGGLLSLFKITVCRKFEQESPPFLDAPPFQLPAREIQHSRKLRDVSGGTANRTLPREEYLEECRLPAPLNLKTPRFFLTQQVLEVLLSEYACVYRPGQHHHHGYL